MAKNTKNKKSRLGRGLSSLMSTPAAIDIPASPTADQPDEASAPAATPPPEVVVEKAADVPKAVDGVTADMPQSVTADTEPAIEAPAAPKLPEAADAAVVEQEDQPPAQTVESANGGLSWIDVLEIRPNAYQPRRIFDEQALEALAESIKQDGVMQPIVVRRASDGEGYEIVAGERRWRAAQRAQANTVPAIVRDLDDRQAAEWAIVENLQREDLNPIERAHAFQRLSDTFSLTHEQVAQRVGVNRSTISNTLRLLDLHPDVQGLVQAGKLSAGHSRALLGISDLKAQAIIAKKVVDEGWSVRVIEAEVKRLNQDPTAPQKPAAAKSEARAAHLDDLEERIGTQLATKVRLKTGRKKGSGSITIEFYDFEQFDSLLSKFGVEIEEQ